MPRVTYGALLEPGVQLALPAAGLRGHPSWTGWVREAGLGSRSEERGVGPGTWVGMTRVSSWQLQRYWGDKTEHLAI